MNRRPSRGAAPCSWRRAAGRAPPLAAERRAHPPSTPHPPSTGPRRFNAVGRVVLRRGAVGRRPGPCPTTRPAHGEASPHLGDISPSLPISPHLSPSLPISLTISPHISPLGWLGEAQRVLARRGDAPRLAAAHRGELHTHPLATFPKPLSRPAPQPPTPPPPTQPPTQPLSHTHAAAESGRPSPRPRAAKESADEEDAQAAAELDEPARHRGARGLQRRRLDALRRVAVISTVCPAAAVGKCRESSGRLRLIDESVADAVRVLSLFLRLRERLRRFWSH